MTRRDPFRASLLAHSAGVRILGAIVLAALLWGAVAWAVALP